MTMQMMNTTARTGPMTQISPSSPSMIGCGSGLSSWMGSENGLAAKVWKTENIVDHALEMEWGLETVGKQTEKLLVRL